MTGAELGRCVVERDGCLFIRRSEPPRLGLGLLFLLPAGFALWNVTGGGFKVDPVYVVFGAGIAGCLIAVLFAYRAPLKYWTRLDLGARTLRLPPRFKRAELPFAEVAGVAQVKGCRMGSAGSIAWFGVRLATRSGERCFVFDSDRQASVALVAERVASALGWPLEQAATGEQIPR